MKDLNHRRTVFPRVAGFDLAAELLRHELLAVTDAEHRQAEVEETRVALGRILVVNALRAARQNYCAGSDGRDRFDRDGARMDLAIDLRLANAARDELRVLSAVVENEDRLPRRHASR
jgi:hypothetical protein